MMNLYLFYIMQVSVKRLRLPLLNSNLLNSPNCDHSSRCPTQ